MDSTFHSYYCKQCGSHDIDGANIEVEITPVSMFREVSKKGFFGGDKWVEEHWKDIYRVGDLVFKNGGVFGGAGYLKCKKCKAEVSGGGFWSQWGQNIADARARGEF